MNYLDYEEVLKRLPDRDADTHKGDYGKILLVCGSRGYTGAPALAAMGALRTGAGLVYLCVPESIYLIEAAKLLEPVILPLEDESGRVSPNAIPALMQYLNNKDAVLIGPGLGQSEGTFLVVKAVLEAFDGPVVVDADGINVLAKHKNILRDRTCPTIITPHEGEFQRICNTKEVNRVSKAVNLAQELGIIVLLKGNRTVITDGKTTYINSTGNPGMAVGGSGDVLAGMIVSLLGQGLEPLVTWRCW